MYSVQVLAGSELVHDEQILYGMNLSTKTNDSRNERDMQAAVGEATSRPRN